MTKPRIAFLVLAVATVIVIIMRHDEQTEPLAEAFGTAFTIVFGVFALLVTGFGVAYWFHKKKVAKRFDDVR